MNHVNPKQPWGGHRYFTFQLFSKQLFTAIHPKFAFWLPHYDLHEQHLHQPLPLLCVLIEQQTKNVKSSYKSSKHDTQHPATQLSKHTLSFVRCQPASLHWLDSAQQSIVPLLALKDNDMPTACL